MPGSTSLAREILLSLGTLVGSNITNPTLAVGVGAVISTYNVPQVVIVFDLPVKIVTAGMILACSHGTGGCRGSRRSA